MEQKTILHKIWQTAQEHPDKLCVFEKGRTVTYAQFKNAIQDFAVYLKGKGIKEGERIALAAEQSIRFLVMVSGIHLAGAISIPLEKNLPVKRIAEILYTLDTKWFLSREKIDIPGITVLSGNEHNEKLLDPGECCAELHFPKPETLADILFTTGTTGSPKGIEMTHSANLAIAENVIDSVALQEDDVELLPTPINHSLGLRRYYGAMYRGSTVGLTNGMVYTEDFFSLMKQYQVTAVTLVPAMLSILLKYSQAKLKEFNQQLRFIQLGSSPISKPDKDELCRLLPQVRLYNTYGATEAGCACILDFNKPEDTMFCIGRPTVNTKVTFVDDSGQQINTSKARSGYMVLEGPMVMNGYWKEPELTKKVLRDGKIYTNDVGYIGEDGNIYLLGRKDDVINSGGNKISPLEIEETALTFESIEECACIPVSNPIAGQVPKLFVVMKPGTDFCPQDILSFLAERLEFFKVPKYITALDKLPRAYNGKILRKALREQEEHYE